MKEKTIGDKILRNAQKQIAEKKERQKEKFKEIYDKPKEYQFPTKINMEKHFYFPKFIGHSGFTSINKAALAVYPALCSQADFRTNEYFHLSRETISKLAGIDVSVVDSGIKNLITGKFHLRESDGEGKKILIPLLERQMKTEGKRHFYNYRAGFVRDIKKWYSVFFIFHTCIVTSGVWSQLSPRAKALYLAMRSVAKFDAYLYADEMGISIYEFSEEFDEKEDYRNRKWDVCTTSMAELCRLVHIDSSKIKPVLKQLEDFHLVEFIDMGYFKVFLKPRIKGNPIED